MTGREVDWDETPSAIPSTNAGAETGNAGGTGRSDAFDRRIRLEADEDGPRHLGTDTQYAQTAGRIMAAQMVIQATTALRTDR